VLANSNAARVGDPILQPGPRRTSPATGSRYCTSSSDPLPERRATPVRGGRRWRGTAPRAPGDRRACGRCAAGGAVLVDAALARPRRARVSGDPGIGLAAGLGRGARPGHPAAAAPLVSRAVASSRTTTVDAVRPGPRGLLHGSAPAGTSQGGTAARRFSTTSGAWWACLCERDHRREPSSTSWRRWGHL
jgi:hypothetical protein